MGQVGRRIDGKERDSNTDEVYQVSAQEVALERKRKKRGRERRRDCTRARASHLRQPVGSPHRAAGRDALDDYDLDRACSHKR